VPRCSVWKYWDHKGDFIGEIAEVFNPARLAVDNCTTKRSAVEFPEFRPRVFVRMSHFREQLAAFVHFTGHIVLEEVFFHFIITVQISGRTPRGPLD